jgi:hypothetical protein
MYIPDQAGLFIRSPKKQNVWVAHLVEVFAPQYRAEGSHVAVIISDLLAFPWVYRIENTLRVFYTGFDWLNKKRSFRVSKRKRFSRGGLWVSIRSSSSFCHVLANTSSSEFIFHS